jgi:IQ domain-containing protein H
LPQIARLFGTRSAAHRIFETARVNTPPLHVDPLPSLADLLAALARLIFAHPHVERWILKIDDEVLGRGVALFDAAALRTWGGLARERARSLQAWLDPARMEAAVAALFDELSACFLRRLVVCCASAYADADAYVDEFVRGGGVIEAAPPKGQGGGTVRAVLFLEPNGAVGLHSSHDLFLDKLARYAGSACPQTRVRPEALRDAAMAVGKAAFQKGIVGWCSVDLAVFEDEDGIKM